MPKQVSAPRFLLLPEVLDLVGVTRSTLYRWMEAGTFPMQISVDGNTVVWVESAVTDWMQDQMVKQCPQQAGHSSVLCLFTCMT